MAKVPEQVTVGPYRYDIVCDDDAHARYVRGNGGDVYGATNHREQAILLATSNGPDVQKVTLAHEVMHALMFATGVDTVVAEVDDALEERLIQLLSPALVEMLRCNPQLVRYLTAGGS